MIRCTPKGVCSWNFVLSGDGHAAEIGFELLFERGRAVIDGKTLKVCKQGMMSGIWTLEEGGQVLFTAEKPNPLTRTFEISGPSGVAALKADSTMGRAMTLTGEGTNCTMAPDHCFTRRATLSGSWDDFRLVVFGFWLTLLLWRRASGSQGGAAG